MFGNQLKRKEELKLHIKNQHREFYDGSKTLNNAIKIKHEFAQANQYAGENKTQRATWCYIALHKKMDQFISDAYWAAEMVKTDDSKNKNFEIEFYTKQMEGMQSLFNQLKEQLKVSLNKLVEGNTELGFFLKTTADDMMLPFALVYADKFLSKFKQELPKIYDNFLNDFNSNNSNAVKIVADIAGINALSSIQQWFPDQFNSFTDRMLSSEKLCRHFFNSKKKLQTLKEEYPDLAGKIFNKALKNDFIFEDYVLFMRSSNAFVGLLSDNIEHQRWQILLNGSERVLKYVKEGRRFFSDEIEPVICFDGHQSDIDYTLSLASSSLKGRFLLAINHNDFEFFDYLQERIKWSISLKTMGVQEKKDYYEAIYFVSQQVANESDCKQKITEIKQFLHELLTLGDTSAIHAKSNPLMWQHSKPEQSSKMDVHFDMELKSNTM